MKAVYYILGIICIGCWCMWSCEKSSSYSDVPEIRFEQLVVRSEADGKKTILTFSFIDGNGDIGVRNHESSDTVSRIYCTWQRKLSDEVYEDFEFGNGKIVQSSEIPYNDKMDRDQAQNKLLKGKIEISLTPPLASAAKADSFRIEFYIIDRALNQSNTDNTPNFKLSDEYTEITK